MTEVVVHAGARSRALGSKKYAVIMAGSTYEEKEAAGFTYLGSGAFKDAYLGPDGLVYKVGNDSETYECDANEARDYADEALRREFHEATKLAREGKRWVAPTSLYEVEGVPVMVQRRYQQAEWSKVERMSASQKSSVRDAERHLTDIYSNNYGFTLSGQVRVFDFGGHGL